MIRSIRTGLARRLVPATACAALLWSTGAQACFVVANGAITFNSMVSPPGCGGIANAFPTMGAAQAFLASLMAATTTTPSTGAAPSTASVLTTPTAAAPSGVPMPSTAMQVFSLNTPGAAAPVNHARLLFEVARDRPEQGQSGVLGLVAAALTFQGETFVDILLYQRQVREDAARAAWDQTPAGKAAADRVAAARARYEAEKISSEGEGAIKDERRRAAGNAARSAEFDAINEFKQSQEFKDAEKEYADQYRAAGAQDMLAFPDHSQAVEPPPRSPGTGTPVLDLGQGRPPDGPPESILDSIGDFVPIS